jgi:hypothetical protein
MACIAWAPMVIREFSLLLSPYDGCPSDVEMSMNYMLIWIFVHGLHLGMMK